MSLHDLLFDFRGRIDRESFWYALAGMLIAFALVNMLTFMLPRMLRDFVFGVAYAGAILPLAAIVVKRLNDRGRSPDFVWLFVGLPVFFSAFELLAQPQPGNRVALALSALYLPVMIWAVIELGFLGSLREGTHCTESSRHGRAGAFD